MIYVRMTDAVFSVVFFMLFFASKKTRVSSVERRAGGRRRLVEVGQIFLMMLLKRDCSHNISMYSGEGLLSVKVKVYIISLYSRFIVPHNWRDCNREYELMTEAHAKLSVVGNCSRSSLCVWLGEGKQLAGRGWSAVARGEGRRTAHREKESGAVNNSYSLEDWIVTSLRV